MGGCPHYHALVWQTNIYVVETRQALPRLSAAEFLAKEHAKEDFRIFDPTSMIEQQTAAQYGLELVTGYHPGIYARHLDLYRKIWKSDSSDFTEQEMHSPRDIACPVILDLMNAKYVVAFENDLGSDYEEVYHTPEHESPNVRHIFQRKTALPRAFLVAQADVPPEGKSVLDTLCKNDPRESCLVEDTPIDGTAAYQPLTIERHSPGDISISVSNTDPGVAVISQAWHPDWYATDNGRPVQLRRVNHNFLGIPLQPGEHQLRIWYRPWDFYLGLALSATALLAILAAGILEHMAARRRGMTGNG